MKQIITSLLDNDLYKLSMQMAVLELFPTTTVKYRFKNRGPHRFTPSFLLALEDQIEKMDRISLSTEEYSWLQDKIPFFKPWYLEYLMNYRFNPAEVKISLEAGSD